jgi:hypothetical protein
MKTISSFYPRFKKPILLCILFCFAVLIRLPQINGVNFLPDSDECVLGVMGNHLLKGQNFPTFFYGQTYGFSTLEAILVAGGIYCWGITAAAIKLPMLLLYLFCLWALFAFVEKKSGVFTAFFFVLLFATEPSWLSWAMKARGGYLTALLLGFVLIYRWQQPSISSRQWVVNGLMLGLLFHCHLFWFIGWFPAAIYYQRNLSPKHKLISFSSTSMTLALLWLVGLLQPEFWSLPASVWHGFPTWTFFYENFKTFLSGHFHYSVTIGLPYGAIIATKLWVMIHLFSLVFLGILLYRKKTTPEIFLWLFISLLLLLIPVFNYNEKIHFRYWLPFSAAFIVFLIHTFCALSPNIRFRQMMALAVVFVGFWTYRAGKDIVKLDPYDDLFSHLHENRETELKRFANLLVQENSHLVFCTDSRLMWLLNFYADGTVFTRFIYNIDRYLPDVEKVNNNFMNTRQTTLIGFSKHPPPQEKLENPDTIRVIDEHFFILKKVNKKTLENLGFRFD